MPGPTWPQAVGEGTLSSPVAAIAVRFPVIAPLFCDVPGRLFR